MTFYVIMDAIITCLEVWFILFLLQNEEISGEKLKQIFLYLSLLISVIIMTSLNINLFIKGMIQILIIVGVGSFIYCCSLYKLSLYGIIHIFSIYVSEGIVIGIWNIYNSPVLANNVVYNDFKLSLVLAIKAFNFFILMLFKKITSKDKEDRTLKEIMPIVFMGLPFLLVIGCLHLMMPIQQERPEHLFYIICCTAILFSFIYILVFYEKHMNMRKKAQQEEVALYELQLRYGYYVRRKEDEERVREIYHDLKNHLLLLKDSKVAELITNKINTYENYINTGNEFLDIIISEKVRIAHQKDIRTECDVDFNYGDFIEPLDISTIFGNLLDNAIEASEKAKAKEKYIFISVKPKGQLLIIAIRNSLANSYNRNMMTSKSNKSFHGYGLVNVKKTVKKYKGEYDITSTNNEFAISVVIPIPKTLEEMEK